MDVNWGDIVPLTEYTGPIEVGWSSDSSIETDALCGWTTPSLKLRKNIWENFPVSLVPINDGDGTDRYAIVWHTRNLAAWRCEKSESFHEWMDFESYCEHRLFHALAMNASRYTVEAARTQDQICVIAMVHDRESIETRTIRSVESSVSSFSSSSSTPLKSLTQIATQFPVVWEQEGNLLRLKFHNKRLRECGESRTVVQSRLVQALKESPAGTYAPTPKGGDKDVICLFTLA